MALNFTTSSANKALFGCVPKFFPSSNKDLFKLNPSLLSSSSSSSSSGAHLRSSAAQSEGSQGRITTEEERQDSFDDAGQFTSTRAQLGLLEQLTSSAAAGYESDSGKLTIREQLAQLVGGDRDDDFMIPLGKKNLKKVSPKFLSISQKRNIRRQSYLNEVSKRNDSVFFATIGGFVLLPPLLILGIAILTGYVQLFP
ncbi:uncharacterized protein LOC104902712 [Beta vulgaris subsp. vulgaris]|uniref:uncharacterized protein LOC104902712 n=1 Tax=Beta vulgaris subsp. vulgaris TaxID=3555 RepID=UPI002036A05E|nr:uncharacterized protein LOC104902712 [Beta vulgaris subsp. vulgaris]